MIVKNEAPIIGYRLRAIASELDGWVIVDTGSTDETVNVVLDEMRAAEIPGTMDSHVWEGFADARTHAVEEATAFAQAKGGDWWALLLDADTVVHFEPGWKRCLVGDVVEADMHHGALRYKHPRLLRLNGHRWRWRGVLHEYLEVPATMSVSHAGASLKVNHGHGGARERNPNKYRDDAELLAKVRADALEPDLDSRYLFYEAQSWRDCGELDKAIDRYIERGKVGGWVGEVYISW
jgi:glycosyltransferase involved in cell wall biosynthesis